MALIAIGGVVGSDEREAAALVDLVDVVYDPRFRGVATAAIGTYGLLVHVCMAGRALFFCFIEYERNMALTAVGGLMLTGKGECCFIMVEGIDRPVKLPAVRRVAEVTAQLEILSMR